MSSFYGGSVRGTELRLAFWPVVTDIRWSHVRNPANHIPTGEHRNPWQCFGLVAEVVTPGSPDLHAEQMTNFGISLQHP